MSRAERRAYKRMMKNADPYALPPAAGTRARAMQAKAARRQQRQASAASSAFWSRRMVTWTIIGALVIGLLAFSITWDRGLPTSLYAGLIGAAAWVALAVAFRAIGRRTPAPPAR